MIHTPFIRILEIILYVLVNSVLYHLSLIYPFRRSLRFPLPACLGILLLPTLVEAGLYILVAFGIAQSSSLVSVLWSVGYMATYCFIVKEPVGKVSFLVLVLLNIYNFCIVAAKCLEGFLFPAHAMERYHLTSSLTLILVELLIVVPHFVTIRRRYTPALARVSEGFLWRYLWLVPATFYFLWHYHIHFNSTTSLEVANDPSNIFFLFVINCGSYLIYYIVLRLINESANNAELRSSNHQLALQTLQYESLQERIAETRKANHDMRHHVTTMNSILEDGDLKALRDYFRTLVAHLPSSRPMQYCQHNTLNLLLTYFSQVADSHGIHYAVDMRLPRSLPIPDNDLTVLIGNLLENAVEAASAQASPQRRVSVCGRIEGRSLLFTLDNTYDVPPKQDRSGVFLSTKHSGCGIGVESARSIVAKHGGQLTIDPRDGLFCVSIMIPL